MSRNDRRSAKISDRKISIHKYKREREPFLSRKRLAFPFLGTPVAHSQAPSPRGEELEVAPDITGVTAMLRWAIIFLVVALIAGVLGLARVEWLSSQIAWILFVVFLILFVVSLVMGRRGGVPPV